MSLNSNVRLTEFAAQLAWRKTDLDQHKTRCTPAYWHHPVYSAGGPGNNDFMLPAWQALVAADADAVLVGIAGRIYRSWRSALSLKML